MSHIVSLPPSFLKQLKEDTEAAFAKLFGPVEAAKGEGIKDPGPDKYNFDDEDRKRKLMALMAFYDEDGPTFDPEGKYLCGSCYYRQLMDSGDVNACHIVDGETKMDIGTCMFYRFGNPDPEWNPLPMAQKFTRAEAGYSERPQAKGFGCFPRCGHADVAEGPDKDGRGIWCDQFGVHVVPKACCYFEGGKDLVTIDT
jgi:hypothetical protein